jgi:hypothetical protein
MIIGRVVVTGQTAQGKSVIVSDAEATPIDLTLMPGYQWLRVWGADTPPSLPTDGSPSPHTGYFPPSGGYRFGFVTFAPDSMLPSLENVDLASGLEEIEKKLPGLAEPMELENPGMHTTDTVDLDLVLSGEIWLELDDGGEVHLKAGDAVIQNGTRHAWRNRSDAPCTVFVALLGADRTHT